jgi:3',5'-cyclic AMP phosphodiesterase CpdA
MPDGPVLLQLSDLHLGDVIGGRTAEERLAAVIAATSHLGVTPDAVLVTGDLANTAADDEYARARELLAGLRAPLHVLPGNHDDAGALRAHFGAACEPVAEVGALRLLMLDTTVPGADGGALADPQLGRLQGHLAEQPHRPTVLAMHHPPIVTGIGVWDAIGLPDADRHALAAVLRDHPQVLRILAGHLHRTMSVRLGATDVLVAPSTFAQARLDLAATEIALADESPGFVVHTLSDGVLRSTVGAA